MTTINPPVLTDESAKIIRDQWLDILSTLVKTVRKWAEELGWSTRQIQIRLEDSEIGAYEAPALLLQMEAVKVLLEPIARSASGADGIVDLYVMPAYDDIARLYFANDEWRFFHVTPAHSSWTTLTEAGFVTLSKTELLKVLEGLRSHEAQAT